jgi:phage shock protein A
MDRPNPPLESLGAPDPLGAAEPGPECLPPLAETPSPRQGIPARHLPRRDRPDSLLDRRARRLHRRHHRLTGAPAMGIFSRSLDIFAANFTELLDRAEDPAKMIRMIILEMEETLVEVRASAARTIADQKEMQRHAGKLDRLQADWADKAQLALSKDREDLARAALLEKRKAADMAGQLQAEIAVLDDSLRAYETDIEKLQNRLREARSRQTQIAARLESAENRVKLRTLLTKERVDEALARFDQLERKVDDAEGRAGALALAQGDATPTLAQEIAALAHDDMVDAELEDMKRALKSRTKE